MRAIFIFFLLINVLFFFWQSGGFSSSSPSDKAVLTAIPTNVNKLVLLSELDSDKPSKPVKDTQKLNTAALKSPLPSQAHKDTKYICFTMGPFTEEEQSTPIALKLRELGALTKRSIREKKIPSGYWVYLPKFSSWKAAREKVMELEQKDMKDMFIMGRGTMKNAISVGLFTSERAARKRISDLVELGEDPKMQVQHTTRPEYWIDIDVEQGKKQVVFAIETIAKSLTLYELVSRECD